MCNTDLCKQNNKENYDPKISLFRNNNRTCSYPFILTPNVNQEIVDNIMKTMIYSFHTDILATFFDDPFLFFYLQKFLSESDVVHLDISINNRKSKRRIFLVTTCPEKYLWIRLIDSVKRNQLCSFLIIFLFIRITIKKPTVFPPLMLLNQLMVRWFVLFNRTIIREFVDIYFGFR